MSFFLNQARAIVADTKAHRENKIDSAALTARAGAGRAVAALLSAEMKMAAQANMLEAVRPQWKTLLEETADVA